ncbi:MAG: hypothetical protein BWY59_00899 [Verrucomicrobia bacterium ADurb.Bin345]|nr:MAG: hypothetical protein BWY59_00899 [Verrucomicrobia bacterium ADurb.Bin345]
MLGILHEPCQQLGLGQRLGICLTPHELFVQRPCRIQARQGLDIRNLSKAQYRRIPALRKPFKISRHMFARATIVAQPLEIQQLGHERRLRKRWHRNREAKRWLQRRGRARRLIHVVVSHALHPCRARVARSAFDEHIEGRAEVHRVSQMQAVLNRSKKRPVEGAVKRTRNGALERTADPEVVIHADAPPAGHGLAVHEEHLVTLEDAPVPIHGHAGNDAPDELPAPRGTEHRVRLSHIVGHRAGPRRMEEPPHPFRERSRLPEHLQFDIRGDDAHILQRNLRLGRKGHRKIANPGLIGQPEECGAILHPMRGAAEEIPQRHHDAGSGRPVPTNLEPHVTQQVLPFRGAADPAVLRCDAQAPDHARPPDGIHPSVSARLNGEYAHRHARRRRNRPAVERLPRAPDIRQRPAILFGHIPLEARHARFTRQHRVVDLVGQTRTATDIFGHDHQALAIRHRHQAVPGIVLVRGQWSLERLPPARQLIEREFHARTPRAVEVETEPLFAAARAGNPKPRQHAGALQIREHHPALRTRARELVVILVASRGISRGDHRGPRNVQPCDMVKIRQRRKKIRPSQRRFLASQAAG